MENLLEILIPLIFAAVYFFGNMLSGKGEDEERPRPRSARRSTSKPYEETDADREYAERQRRIQEEIRRKIEERRQAAREKQEDVSAPTATPPPIAENLRSRRRAVQERLKERQENQKETHESVHETPPHLMPTHELESASDSSFSWDESDNVYEQGMAAQLKKIEETKRQAEVLRRKAESAAKQRQAIGQADVSAGRSGLSGPVRDNLKDPSAARAAFIYGEVLGQPVSLRKSGTLPGLSGVSS